VEAFDKAGSEGLFNALEKMPSKGRIAITGTLGYDISFIRKIPTENGFKIRVLTLASPSSATISKNTGETQRVRRNRRKVAEERRGVVARRPARTRPRIQKMI